jgi:peptidylprolyl isomerase
MMAQAKTGDTVKVHYTGKLEDNTIFDTSEGREPLQFTIGEGRLIPDFEQAVVGMKPGETKTINVPPERAYGPHLEEMVMVVNRQDIPEDLKPEVNQRLQVQQADGQACIVTVTSVSDSSVTLDGNHPLAGKQLTFDIQLAEIA